MTITDCALIVLAISAASVAVVTSLYFLKLRGDLLEQEESELPPALTQFIRTRVLVNSTTKGTAWRGILSEQLADDAIVLEAVELIEGPTRDGKPVISDGGELVVIPAGRIQSVQVLRGDTE